MISRLWPRSLMGQMLLAVALALLVVQGVGAFLIYQAQAERRETILINGAAFRLLVHVRRSEGLSLSDEPPRRFRHRPHRIRVERTAQSPLRANETSDSATAAQLQEILGEQGVETQAALVTHRAIEDDPFTLERLKRTSDRFRRGRGPAPDKILVAAVRQTPDGDWMVTRIPIPTSHGQIALSLLWQTVLIYLVVMVAVGFIIRRIARPLAALTGRLERFAAAPSLDQQLVPEGPDDVRRLILAHNAMEARIAALLDEKDVMLGAIGHDLKTPLAALRVRIETVEDEKERERMAATIEDITHSLDDILSLARVGRPGDEPERNELSALVASVVEEYEDMGRPVDLGDSERIVFALRPTWLRRAMRNLIDNALRYGERATVNLSREDGFALIRIEDEGPGIAESEIDAMMDPFTRGEPSRNTETGGAGLGLALARAIAEQHEGTLQLANRRGPDGAVEGLTATLRLPLN